MIVVGFLGLLVLMLLVVGLTGPPGVTSRPR